jgi:hypothetical protein
VIVRVIDTDRSHVSGIDANMTLGFREAKSQVSGLESKELILYLGRLERFMSDIRRLNDGYACEYPGKGVSM